VAAPPPWPVALRSKKAIRIRALLSVASSGKFALGCGGSQPPEMMVVVSCAPSAEVPSKSGATKMRWPARAAARLRSVWIIGRMVPAGSSSSVAAGSW
jgi:hypothetical protein